MSIILRFLPLLIVLALQIYCVLDCVRTDDFRVKHLPKVLWLLLIVIAPLVGSVVWLAAGRDRPEGFLPRPKPRPSAPRGPDDDPDFLRGLK